MLQEELRRISTSISIGTIRGQPSNIIIESTLKGKPYATLTVLSAAGAEVLQHR